MQDTRPNSLFYLFAVETLRGIDARNQDVSLLGTEEDDSWLVLGNVLSGNNYTAKVDMGAGNDSFRAYGSMESHNGGMTEIANAETVTVSSKLLATSGGSNRIYCPSDIDTTVNIAGLVEASGGTNTIYANTVTLNAGLLATSGGKNRIVNQNNENGVADNVTIYGDVTAVNGSNSIDPVLMTDSRSITIHGDVSSDVGSWFGIAMGDGNLKEGSVNIDGRLVTSNDSSARISISGRRSGELNIGEGVFTHDSKTNIEVRNCTSFTTKSLLAQGDDYRLTGNQVILHGQQSTEGNLMVIEDGMSAVGKTENYVAWWGLSTADTTNIVGGMTSIDGGRNYIELSSYSEHNTLYLSGDYTSSENRWNEIYAYGSNNTVYMDGYVGLGGLSIDAGGAYDMLTLSATNTDELADNYQEWLNPTGNSASIYGFESLRVDLADTQVDMQSMQWLGDYVEAYNASGRDFMDLELNTDKFGRTLSLDDFFSSQTDDIFTALNLGGEIANTLEVAGTLGDNGIEAFTFKVHGDSNDAVQLSNEWMYIGDGDSAAGPEYSYYTTGFDLLMVEAEINVIVGA